MKIWEPKTPGTLWATSGLLRDCFTFYYFYPLSALRTSSFKNRLPSLNGTWIILPGSQLLTHYNLIFKFPACSFTCVPPCTSLNVFFVTGTNSPWKFWAWGFVDCYNIDPGRGPNSRLFNWYWGRSSPGVMWPGCAAELSLHFCCWGLECVELHLNNPTRHNV